MIRLESEIRSGRFLPRLEAEKRTLAEAIDRWSAEHQPGSSLAGQLVS